MRTPAKKTTGVVVGQLDRRVVVDQGIRSVSAHPLPLLLLSQLLVLQMVMELQSLSLSIRPPMLQLPPPARLITPLVWLISTRV